MYDIIGNAAEWCLDYYTAHLGTDAVVDPVGPSTPDGANQRCLRGGEYSGYYSSSNASEYRAACRNRIDTYYQQGFLGFRLRAPAIAVMQ